MRETISKLLRWKISGWAITTCIGFWWLTTQLHHFLASYLAVGMCGALAIGSWLCSDTLAKKRRAVNVLESRQDYRKRKTITTYQREINQYLLLKGGVTALLLAMTLASLGFVRFEQSSYELSLLYGKLYPAKDIVRGLCAPQKGQLALYVGSFVVVVPSDALPVGLVWIIRKSGEAEHVLDLDRDSDGTLVLVADLKDRNDNLVIRLDKTGFRVNPNNYFDYKHPDRSTLVVFDQKGKAVINARLLNDRSFRVTGLFHSLGKTIDLSKGMTPGNISLANICMVWPPELKGRPYVVYAMPK